MTIRDCPFDLIKRRKPVKIRTSPQGVTSTKRGLTHHIELDDWRAVMDSTQGAPSNFRTPSRWNSVPIPERVAQRATTNVDVNASGCWISRYSVASHGYAQIGWQTDGDRHVVLAHRAAWTHVNGQVPLGLTIDHLCKQRRCVNPEHLRLLPNFENARRVSGKNWAIGTCANGHSAEHLVSIDRELRRGTRRVGLICSICRPVYQARYAFKMRNPNSPMPQHLLLASERVAS